MFPSVLLIICELIFSILWCEFSLSFMKFINFILAFISLIILLWISSLLRKCFFGKSVIRRILYVHVSCARAYTHTDTLNYTPKVRIVSIMNVLIRNSNFWQFSNCIPIWNINTIRRVYEFQLHMRWNETIFLILSEKICLYYTCLAMFTSLLYKQRYSYSLSSVITFFERVSDWRT